MPRVPEIIPAPSSLSIHHLGPPLKKGPLPSFFYFALSALDSLTLDPYNQPIQFLESEALRCFSFTLPGHGPGLKNSEALSSWATAFQQGNDILAPFLEGAGENIQFLVENGWVDKEKIAVAGLSRGGFAATLLGAMQVDIKWILAFAPMTNLRIYKEFQTADVAEFAEKYDLKKFINQLVDKSLRFYIGNRDLKVSTDACFELIRLIADQGYAMGKRSCKTELMISPSIGNQGHGTPPHLFKEGIEWLKKEWNI